MENAGYAICCQSVVPMRAEASHRSEMVSQLLFNETCSVIVEHGEWSKIVVTHDGYEGWVVTTQIKAVGKETFDELNAKKQYYVNEAIVNHDGLYLTLGTPLFEPVHAKAVQDSFNADVMIENAHKLLGTPYLWGGRTVMGIDCSGFVQICARMAGISLPRDASQQVNCGETVYFLQEVQPGDLAFFSNDNGSIVHVGMLLSNEQIIHASGKVRIDSIDNEGIFNADLRKHTHRLTAIKRINHQNMKK